MKKIILSTPMGIAAVVANILFNLSFIIVFFIPKSCAKVQPFFQLYGINRRLFLSTYCQHKLEH
jgi:hypothetical protein